LIVIWGDFFHVLGGNHWNNKTDLTYNTYRYITPDLEKSVVDREIAKAFRLWQEVTPLTFTLVETTEADIKIGCR
jgi:hypothetical protein